MKKGFTLIELMIVIAVIGILSAVIIPKVGAIKLQSKNNGVASNALLVRSYLENRSGKDGIEYQSDTSAGQTPEQALTTVLNNIGTDMTSNFTLSNALINYFTNNNSINYSQGNVNNKTATTATSVLVYYCTDTLPADNNAVSSSSLPNGTGYTGDIITIVYGTGYVVYGVDNIGAMVSINIIKFPPTPPNSVSGVYPGDGSNSAAVQANVNRVVSYIQSIAMDRILKVTLNSSDWTYLRSPLYNDLNTEFTPGSLTAHIVNPLHANIDTIGEDNNYIDPSKNYAIIDYPQQDISQEDTKYSGFTGAVVVYITPDPSLGYVVYGVDSNGKQISKTQIKLSTLVTNDMTNKLSNNVKTVSDILKSNISYNVSTSKNSTAVMQSLANSELSSLSISNAYDPNWVGKGTDTYNFLSGYALVVENAAGGYVNSYRGCVIVDTLSDGSGYEVYGIDYNGNINGDVKINSSS